jgi:drug/metabolite transporter (DMT)-like permease
MTKFQWLGVVAIFVGNLAIGGFTGFKWNIGEIMILAATILWAIENIIAKKALADISAQTVAAFRMIVGSLILGAYVGISGSFVLVASLSAVQWGWTLATATLLAGYVLTWYSALKQAPATYVATLLVPATLVTNALSAVFITHALSPRDISMFCFYAAGTMLVVMFGKKHLIYPTVLQGKTMTD